MLTLDITKAASFLKELSKTTLHAPTKLTKLLPKAHAPATTSSDG